MFKSMIYASDKTGNEYTFEIEFDQSVDPPQYIATCEKPNGGINSSAHSVEALVEMIPDAVATWETDDDW